MGLKKILKRIIIGYKADSESYVNYLRKIGVKIGDGVEIYRPFNTTIDTQNPHLLEIGNNVQITGPVTILTHDYSWSVLKAVYGEILGNQRKTTIGNNCFIGWGATILGGTTIGDNVIIGANAVVSGKIDSNSVYAGNPAKKILTLEEFYEKRKKRQLQEATSYVNNYMNIYNKIPDEKELDEYFYLFSKDVKKLIPEFDKKLKLMGNYDYSKEVLENQSEQPFNNYLEFIESCKKSD